MKIADLIENIQCEIVGDSDIEICSLCCHTAKVTQGCLYFCIVGSNSDGHDFATKAVADGAVAIVTERRLVIDATQIIVDDSRKYMALIAKKFYNNAVDKLKTIGVVGTNGKTSTTYLLAGAIEEGGYNTAIIGTNGIIINGVKYASYLTTPDPIELHFWFAKMVEEKINYVIVEVSAHAIALRKITGILFDALIFTNFSQDHLDFFGDMNEYARIKKSIFDKKYTKVAIINNDDELGRTISMSTNVPVVTYGCDNPADVFALDYAESNSGMQFVINLYDEVSRLYFDLHGKFNVYNILASATTARVFGIKLRTITQGIRKIKRIEGRNETFYRKDGCRIVIDFAHTPDGINNILKYLAKSKKGRLIVVFGCGGNRDRFKRPIMAQAVSNYADYCIVTNDNPRYESDEQIIGDIVDGMNIEYDIIYDRKEAILRANELARANDTIAILGKGAEAYQEIKGKRIPYSDFDVVHKILS